MFFDLNIAVKGGHSAFNRINIYLRSIIHVAYWCFLVLTSSLLNQTKGGQKKFPWRFQYCRNLSFRAFGFVNHSQFYSVCHSTYPLLISHNHISNLNIQKFYTNFTIYICRPRFLLQHLLTMYIWFSHLKLLHEIISVLQTSIWEC